MLEEFRSAAHREFAENIGETRRKWYRCSFGEVMSTPAQDRGFLNDVVGSELLERAAVWIGRNMEPEDVFSESSLREHARNNFEPEDIFTSKKLGQWAEENGYSEPE